MNNMVRVTSGVLFFTFFLFNVEAYSFLEETATAASKGVRVILTPATRKHHPLRQRLSHCSKATLRTAQPFDHGKRSFSTGKNDFQPKTELGKVFKRVVTHETSNYKKITPQERHLLMHTRWVTGLHFDDQGRFLLKPHSIEKGNGDPNPHFVFHKTLADRIGNNTSVRKLEKVKLNSPTSVDARKDLDKDADRWKDNSFVEGHFYTLKGRTKTPKVFVTLYDPKKAEGEESCFLSWLLPIEQAFFCSTLSNYMDAVAVLKSWGAYSRLALAVIPENTYLSLRFGLVAPQSFPQLNKDFELDLQQRNVLQNKLAGKGDIRKFHEKRRGGATQFYIGYACSPDKKGLIPSHPAYNYDDTSPISLYDLDALNLSGKQFNFPDHASNPEYDKMEITIHNAFKNTGIVTPAEHADIDGILTRYIR